MSTSLLEVEAISAGYGDLRALWDFSLSVKPGEASVVLGPNGAGKTTALLALAGVLSLRAGKISLDGIDVSAAPSHRRCQNGIAMVQEGKRVFRHRTVEDNLLLGAFSLRRSERRAAIERTLVRFPMLESRLAMRASQLSGGQQQMLAIAQALIPGPSVILLDEPSAGLAPIIMLEVLDVIRDLKRDGVAVVLVEQVVDQALSVADHVTLLDRGRVTVSAPTGTVDAAELRDRYLGV